MESFPGVEASEGHDGHSTMWTQPYPSQVDPILEIWWRLLGRVPIHLPAMGRESLPELLANPESERNERNSVSPGDMEPNPKQVLCLFYFQFHEATNIFLRFNQFHMSFLSFISKRALIDRVSLINYSHSKPIWSCSLLERWWAWKSIELRCITVWLFNGVIISKI